MDFFKFASDRYSVRKFQNKALAGDVIDKILACGHVAPTGCNYQPQRILVLNTAESIEKLKSCTKCHFDAPTAMLICYNRDETWVRKYDGATSAPTDAAIVTTHLMLMAHSLGVGSCWVMHFDPEAVRKEFSVPENYIPHSLLVMGYPHEDSVPNERHSQTRPIDEVVYYEKFQ